MEDKITNIIQQGGDAKEVDELLKQGANVNFINLRNRCSFLHLAVLHNRTEIVEILIKHKINIDLKDRDRSLLHIAIQKSADPIIVKLLIDAGANVRDASSGGATLLQLALTARPPNPAIIELLVAAGANLNFTDPRDGNSCLHLAVKTNSLEVVELFKKNKVAIDIRNSQGATPLHLAAEMPTNLAIVKLLIDAGADINLPDRNGMTALYLVASARDRNTHHSMDSFIQMRVQMRECIKFLLRSGAEINPYKDAKAISSKVAHQGLAQIEMIHNLSTELTFEQTIEKLQKQNEQQQYEIAQLKTHIYKLQKQQENINERYHKKARLDKPQGGEKIVKIQSLFRGYLVRKKQPLSQIAMERQTEIKARSPEVISQFIREGKYHEASKLTAALQEQRWHEAMQIIRDVPETILQGKNGLKIKY